MQSWIDLTFLLSIRSVPSFHLVSVVSLGWPLPVTLVLMLAADVIKAFRCAADLVGDGGVDIMMMETGLRRGQNS